MKDNIKVLIISTVRLRTNGITSVILNYFRHITNNDRIHFDFLFPSMQLPEYEAELRQCGSNAFELNCRIKNPIKYISKLTKIIKNGGYDIVHAHGNSCTLAFELYAAKKAGVKVRIAHSHSTNCKNIKINKALRPWFDKLYTDGFACGEDAGKWLFPKGNFIVVRNGVDLEKFLYNSSVRSKYREKYGLSDNIVIGHVGLFNEGKNHKYLIEIFRELYSQNNKYRLLLIGDGSLKPTIEVQVKKYSLTDAVIFAGLTEEVAQHLFAMDVFVMPSLYEGLPLSLIEAQAAGLSFVVADTVTKEVDITGQMKFISLNASPKEWADAIMSMQPINRENESRSIRKKIIDSGYDIRTESLKVKKIYIQKANSLFSTTV